MCKNVLYIEDKAVYLLIFRFKNKNLALDNIIFNKNT